MNLRLGNNPLSSTIFQKTSTEEPTQAKEQESQNTENGNQKEETIIQQVEREDKPAIQEEPKTDLEPEAVYDKVTVRLPVELNDWLDETVRKTKRMNGVKIRKEVFIQIALEALRAKNLDLSLLKSDDDLKRLFG